MWPDHCVQGTRGAEFCMDSKNEFIQPKGTRKDWDSYSAVKDDGGQETGLAAHLREKGINTAMVIGLAGDICVKFTAHDLKEKNFEVYAIPELCRCIDRNFDWKNYTNKGVPLLANPAPSVSWDTPFKSRSCALIIVDYQKDFMEGGALAVGGADQKYKSDMDNFIEYVRKEQANYIVWSQDHHPAGHSSFLSSYTPEQQTQLNMQLFMEATLTRKGPKGEDVKYQQVMWPDHCIQGTPGADFMMEPLNGELIQPKGTRLEFDSYSAVKDDGGEQTGLAAHLREKKIDTCICIGLAGDFCVHATATDLKAEGFKVYAIPELCRCVGSKPDFSYQGYYAGIELLADPTPRQ